MTTDTVELPIHQLRRLLYPSIPASQPETQLAAQAVIPCQVATETRCLAFTRLLPHVILRCLAASPVTGAATET